MASARLIAFSAALLATAAVWMLIFQMSPAWAVLVVLALGWGVAAGRAWERPLARQLASENDSLRREVDRHREEISQFEQRSTEIRSEAALALRDSEALYHSLVDHLPLSVLRKDRDGKYTFVSRRYLDFSGKEAAEIIGTTDFDLFPVELATKYRAGDDQVLATGQLFEDIEAYRKPDGETRYIQVLKTPVRDAEQRIIGTQVMFWDVTDRHRAEESLEKSARELERRNKALEESEQNLQRQTNILMSVLNSIAEGVVVADEHGRFVVWNPAADRIIGLGPMDKPTATWPQVYGLFQTDRVTPLAADQVPLARAIRGETVTDIEVYVRNRSRSDGVLLRASGAPLVDPDGQIKGGVVVFRDVTRQKAAEEALRHSEERARQIVETAYDPFVSIDSEGRVLDWNTQAQTTFGWARDEVRGKVLAELIIPPRFREAHTAGIRRFLETGVGPVLNTRIEVAALHRDGHEFPVELTVWPVRSPDGCCFNAFVHDITERKAAEAEIRSKNQDLETLLYVTSHDLREPLRAIENFARLVCERYADKLDAKGQDFLQ